MSAVRTLSPAVALLAVLAVACGGSGRPSAAGAGKGGPPKRGGGWVGEVVVEWLRFRAPREWVVVGSGGVAVGPVGHPLALTLFTRREWAEDVRLFLRTYAPFHLRTEEGDLAFTGRGSRAASPAEQRMIAGWTRRVAAEAILGRNESYGLALAWHRSGSAGVACDELDVYTSGEVWASSCLGQPALRGRLDDAQLSLFYGWFDGLAPFQASGEEGTRLDAPPARLTFAGRGRKAATPAETAAIEAFAAALFRELAGTAARAAAPPPEPPPLALPDDVPPPQRAAPRPPPPPARDDVAEPEPPAPPP